MKPILSPWTDTFDSFAQSIRQSAIVVAPFITDQPLQQLASRLSGRADLRISIVTNLAPDSLLQGYLDSNALADFCKEFSDTIVYHLPGLHAKVYVADDHTAIITSGNLTSNSLHHNFEYGIELHAPVMVRRITRDLVEYSELGARVTVNELDRLTAIVEILKDKYARTLGSTRTSLRREFENQLERTNESLRELRGSRGESTNSIFARTLLYLLKKGPMETRNIHPLIRDIHPDLCDDRTHRIINGVHFGREWKHRVRGAQVDLRRRGLIELADGEWRLVDGE